VVTIDFDDMAGLNAYLQHPAHAPVGERFGSLLSSSMVFDFEVGNIDEWPRLVG
jgi:hypothetical protein